MLDTESIVAAKTYKITNLCEHNIELPMPPYPDDYKGAKLTQAKLQLGPQIDANDPKALPYTLELSGAELLFLCKRRAFEAMVAQRKIQVDLAGRTLVIRP